MTTSNNQLPIDKQPSGDICIPVSVPNDTQWLWLLAKCLSFPTARRFWIKGNDTDTDLVMAEWDSRVYNPVVDRILARDLCAEAGEDDCLEYPTNHGMIEFEPMSPFSEPGEIPDGYLLPPFVRYADLVFEDLPDWLADIIAEITGEFTGYEPNDVLSLIGSFPLDLTDWEGALTNGLPRFTVQVEDKGTLELHMLAVPFGGMALVTLDVEPNIPDIIGGIFADGLQIIELQRDLSSIPPELNVEVIHEVKIETSGEHIVHVTFIPNIDLSLLPTRFGGGVRSVVWCSDNIPDEECPEELTIPEIIADDTYFETEYVPAVFGGYYSETVANETAQAAAYDSTPQSIGANIPTGTPDGVQKNSLCAAINRFVSLYASTKLCLIQSQNFIEVFWHDLASSINEFYEQVVSLMSPIYSPNIFSCFVDDAAAMTALQNASAIEEVACHIYDELKTVTMSQANFDAAILDAATVLTGDAQKIACLMNNDNNQSLYINLLEGYQIKLNSGDAECPCETSDYWRLLLDFTTGNRFGTTVMVWNGNNNDGQWSGNGYEYITPVVAITSLNAAFGLMSLGGAFVVRAYATKSNRAGSDNGGNDLTQGLFYSGEGLTGTNTSTFSNSAIPDGTDLVAGAINASATAIVKSFVSRNRVLQRTDTAPHTLLVKQCVIWGLAESGSGNKPPLAQWAGNTLPGTLAGLFPS